MVHLVVGFGFVGVVFLLVVVGSFVVLLFLFCFLFFCMSWLLFGSCFGDFSALMGGSSSHMMSFAEGLLEKRGQKRRKRMENERR